MTLGVADRFRFFTNAGAELTLVELERAGARQIILLRPKANGFPQLEYLNGTLAVAAGRTPWAGLEGLSFNYEAFSRSAVIVIVRAPDGAGERHVGQGAAPTDTIEVQISEHVEAAKALLTAAE